MTSRDTASFSLFSSDVSSSGAQEVARLLGTDASQGLSEDEVRQRHREGFGNTLPPRSGRTTSQIIKDNVLTRINALLGILFVLVMTTGSWINGAFGLLIIANSIIGIVQELRAKRTLESLAVVGEAHPRVLREGNERTIKRDDVILGDIILVSPGEQVVVDGKVVHSRYLEADESLLTGESDAIVKSEGDELLSGSFISSGTGAYIATRVGVHSYASQLTAEASKYTLAHSQLQSGIDKILRVITWFLVPIGILTVIGQISIEGHSYKDIVLAVTGALVPMIPEGLVLITSTAFALGVVRLGRRKCLVNELPAIEGLARVDVVCADKTGTLTENAMMMSVLECASGVSQRRVEEILRQLATADDAPNSSMKAIKESVGVSEAPWKVIGVQPFTSAKKFSGVTFDIQGNVKNIILGAPDVLLPEHSPHTVKVQSFESQGLRVLVLGEISTNVEDIEEIDDFSFIALVVLEQKLREDAAETLEYFASQDMKVKIISGDNALSVAAVATKLGMRDVKAIDARSLTYKNLDACVEENDIFGRVTPDQKRDIVKSLQKAGHTVAMTGDGVNDVLALKDADLGVAMGSGASATRSVGKIVLLDDRFATLPHVVSEGRRVLGNIERVANLFLTKTIYSSLIAMFVLISGLSYPFLPIHVTITGWFTIGVPAFLLSLPPNNERAKDGFVARVLRFGIPSGFIVALSSFGTYVLLAGRYGATDMQVSTAALLALIIPSTWVLVTVARPYEWWKILLIFLPLVGYGLIFTFPLTQELFLLDSSNLFVMAIGGGIGFVAAASIEIVWWVRRLFEATPTPVWKKTL